MKTRKDIQRAARAPQRGFTLLELLVGIGLIAIVLGISTPMLSVIRSNYVLDGTSRQLAMEITKARMQAIAQNRTVRLRLDSPNVYYLESSEDGSNFAPITAPVFLPTGVAIVTGSGGTPQFNRQGMAPTSTTISVVNPAGTKIIRTSALGRVTRS